MTQIIKGNVSGIIIKDNSITHHPHIDSHPIQPFIQSHKDTVTPTLPQTNHTSNYNINNTNNINNNYNINHNTTSHYTSILIICTIFNITEITITTHSHSDILHDESKDIELHSHNNYITNTNNNTLSLNTSSSTHCIHDILNNLESNNLHNYQLESHNIINDINEILLNKSLNSSIMKLIKQEMEVITNFDSFLDLHCRIYISNMIPLNSSQEDFITWIINNNPFYPIQTYVSNLLNQFIDQGLSDIFNQIQHELYEKRKQLPTYTWNNNTHNVKLQTNTNINNNNKTKIIPKIEKKTLVTHQITTTDDDGDTVISVNNNNNIHNNNNNNNNNNNSNIQNELAFWKAKTQHLQQQLDIERNKRVTVEKERDNLQQLFNLLQSNMNIFKENTNNNNNNN
eukprot:31583_1